MDGFFERRNASGASAANGPGRVLSDPWTMSRPSSSPQPKAQNRENDSNETKPQADVPWFAHPCACFRPELIFGHWTGWPAIAKRSHRNKQQVKRDRWAFCQLDPVRGMATVHQAARRSISRHRARQ
jgi:hypothetical protein